MKGGKKEGKKRAQQQLCSKQSSVETLLEKVVNKDFFEELRFKNKID
jgi:hypothetical protein